MSALGPLALAALAAAAAACAPAAVPPRVYMIEEDSHPHEVRPASVARFHVPAVTRPSRVDVKCALAGPAPSARLEFHGIRPGGWAARGLTLAVGDREIFVDIEGIAEPGHPGPHFAIANDDAERLLWHQCYNN